MRSGLSVYYKYRYPRPHRVEDGQNSSAIKLDVLGRLAAHNKRVCNMLEKVKALGLSVVVLAFLVSIPFAISANASDHPKRSMYS